MNTKLTFMLHLRRFFVQLSSSKSNKRVKTIDQQDGFFHPKNSETYWALNSNSTKGSSVPCRQLRLLKHKHLIHIDNKYYIKRAYSNDGYE